MNINPKTVASIPLTVILAGAVYAGDWYLDGTYVRQDALSVSRLLSQQREAQKAINRFEYISTYRTLTREEGFDLRQARDDLSAAESGLKELEK